MDQAEFCFGLEGKLREEQYRDHLSDYHNRDQSEHAEGWILFEKNLSQGKIIRSRFIKIRSGLIVQDENMPYYAIEDYVENNKGTILLLKNYYSNNYFRI